MVRHTDSSANNRLLYTFLYKPSNSFKNARSSAILLDR